MPLKRHVPMWLLGHVETWLFRVMSFLFVYIFITCRRESINYWAFEYLQSASAYWKHYLLLSTSFHLLQAIQWFNYCWRRKSIIYIAEVTISDKYLNSAKFKLETYLQTFFCNCLSIRDPLYLTKKNPSLAFICIFNSSN